MLHDETLELLQYYLLHKALLHSLVARKGPADIKDGIEDGLEDGFRGWVGRGVQADRSEWLGLSRVCCQK